MDILTDLRLRAASLGAALLVLATASASSAYAECAFVRQVMIGLKVQGYASLYVGEPELVSRAMAFLREHGLEGAPEETNGILLVALEEESRISLVVDGCVDGMIIVDKMTAEAFRDVIDGEPDGRDA